MITLRQWAAIVDGKKQPIFTPEDCGYQVALAIARAHFGVVAKIGDEGSFYANDIVKRNGVYASHDIGVVGGEK